MDRNPYSHKYPSLASVVHATVKAAPSGLDTRTVADFLGKPYQTLMSELSGQPGHKAGMDLLLPLMDVTGSTAPLDFLAREMGGVYVALPSRHTEHPVHQECLTAVREFGELMAETGDALLDGKISRDECERVSRSGYRAIQAISALLLAMSRARDNAERTSA